MNVTSNFYILTLIGGCNLPPPPPFMNLKATPFQSFLNLKITLGNGLKNSLW
jgi:hypothetical protein